MTGWTSYLDGGRDEMIRAGEARPHSAALVHDVLALALEELLELGVARDRLQTDADMNFTLAGEQQRLFPLDLLPRLVERSHWLALCAGLEQRAMALNAFIRDLAGPAEALSAGIVPRSVVQVPRDLVGGVAPATVAGMDLLREADGGWRVLEDNLRVPSGIGYAMMARSVTTSLMPESAAAHAISAGHDAPDVLLAGLVDAAPARCAGAPTIVVLSIGPTDSASAEHRLLASRMAVPLITPNDLSVSGDGISYAGETVDVIYRRIDDVQLAAAFLGSGQPANEALTQAVRADTLTMCNALGCGVADDKAVYAFVPRLIEFYLGAAPLLADVPTFVLVDPDHREQAMDRLNQLVVKPVDGYGGHGVVFGEELSATELDELRRKLLAEPGAWIAQEPISASTVPTFQDGEWRPCTVDLRAFVVSGKGGASTLSSPLTRVATHGSRIVNSSQGGGCKDTWIIADS